MKRKNLSGTIADTFSPFFSKPRKKTVFKDSEIAHDLLDDLWGVEIGGSAHNPFNLPHCMNVDYSGSMDNVFKKEEIKLCGTALKVDIIASGDNLPFKDNSIDYVISSHVLEHFVDPIKTLKEWYRIIKPGGYIFAIVPHVDRVPEERRSVTPVDVLINRHQTGHMTSEDAATMSMGIPDHYAVFNLENCLEMCEHLKLKVIATEDPDKKVGNGFTVIVQK